MRLVLTLWVILSGAALSSEAPHYANLHAPPHSYSDRVLKDPFTLMKADFENGRIPLDHSSERAFVLSLLKALDIPVESQLLVFSTTSLQLSLISPANPRALYFNEELYVGYIPGGKIEIISLDPELGGIFYIFPIPKGEQPLAIERSGRCMNCHTGAESRYIPGLVIKSVVPAPSGGTLDAFRADDTGHHIPLAERFGGWYLTGNHSISNHWGNLIGRMQNGEIHRRIIEPGRLFDVARYPAPGSDILAHLVHEHQAGFVNRVIEASYRTRSILHSSGRSPASEQAGELDSQARSLVRYILFADETPLTSSGIDGDAGFKSAFLRNRRIAANGISLKDFDLKTRLFKQRCSYMIYSGVFAGMPSEMKERVFKELALALGESRAEYDYIPPGEKRQIRTILSETLPDAASFF